MSKTKIRVIPAIEFADCDAPVWLEGIEVANYGMTKRNPAPGRRSQVFPHPDLETEPTIQKWLGQWPKARFDIFTIPRPFVTPGVTLFVQEWRDGKWQTLPAGIEWEVGEDNVVPIVAQEAKAVKPRKRRAA